MRADAHQRMAARTGGILRLAAFMDQLVQHTSSGSQIHRWIIGSARDFAGDWIDGLLTRREEFRWSGLGLSMGQEQEGDSQ